MNVAIVQAHLEWENVPVNLKLFNKRIAAIEGANIIVLPEMFASGFTMKGKERVAPFYEAVYQCMQEWAREKDALIMGSTVYFEDEHYYNRLLVAFPDGKILHYDKKHLFTMGEEKEHFTAGNELLVFDYQGVRIAPFICYDLRLWLRLGRVRGQLAGGKEATVANFINGQGNRESMLRHWGEPSGRRRGRIELFR